MFNTKDRGHRPCIVLMVLAVFSTSRVVRARPQGYPSAVAQERAQEWLTGPAAAVPPAVKPVLRFSPETSFDQALRSSGSAASMYPHFPPSSASLNLPVAGSSSSAKNKDPANPSSNGIDKKGIPLPSNDGDVLGVRDVDVDDYESWLDDLYDQSGPAALLGKSAAPADVLPKSSADTGLRKHVPTTAEKSRHVDTPNVSVHSAKHKPSEAGDVPVPNDVPTISEQLVPWQELIERDVDVDRPVRHNVTKPRIIQNSATAPNRNKGDSVQIINPKITSFWEERASADLDVDEENEDDKPAQFAATAQDQDVDREEDDDNMNDVPIELAIQVIEAMEAQPEWRKHLEPEPKKAKSTRRKTNKPDWEIFEDSSSDAVNDWNPLENFNPQGSHLLALIFETIDEPEHGSDRKVLEPEDDRQPQREKDTDLLQLINNFPFQMLMGGANFELVEETYEDYYDSDEDYEDYDEDEYDGDDDEFESYEDYDEDDELVDVKYDVSLEQDTDKYLKNDSDNESEEDDDFPYGDEFDFDEDCDDADCNEDDAKVTKDIFTLIPLPPMLTKK